MCFVGTGVRGCRISSHNTARQKRERWREERCGERTVLWAVCLYMQPEANESQSGILLHQNANVGKCRHFHIFAGRLVQVERGGVLSYKVQWGVMQYLHI